MMRALLISVFVLASWAAAQECTTQVVVNVYNPKLHLDIQTLKASDFTARLEEGKIPLSIAGLGQDYSSRLLVLLETDDAADSSKIGDVVDTVTRMAQQAPDGQPVAFGVYADRAVFTKGFFSDPKERAAAIGNLREETNDLGKRVALYDALLQAARLFGEHQPGDTVLLVGNPFDDMSSHSPSAVEKEFLATGTRLLIMLREPLSNISRDYMTNSHTLEKTMFGKLPQETGGAYSDFDPHFFGWGWRGYLMRIKLPEDAHMSRPKKWKLKFQGAASVTFHHARIYYPDLLPACKIGK